MWTQGIEIMLKRIIPWVVSLGLLVYIAWTTDPARAWDAFQRADFLRFLVVLAVGIAVGYLYDSLSLTLLFRRFNAPVGFREILWLKGASYLLNIVNYNAAMGGIAVYLRRVRRVDLLEGGSSLLLLNVIDILGVCILITLGLLFAGETVATVLTSEVTRALGWILIGAVTLVAGALLYWNAGWNFLVFGRLRNLRIFHAFREARVVDYLWLIGLRLGLLLVYVTFTWQIAACFNLQIPFGAMLTLQPIVMLVGTIPVSVAGLGTTQMAMRVFYGGFASYLALGPLMPLIGELGAGLGSAATGASHVVALAAGEGAALAAQNYLNTTPLVDTMSTAGIFGIILVRLVIGYICIGRVAKLMV